MKYTGKKTKQKKNLMRYLISDLIFNLKNYFISLLQKQIFFYAQYDT